MAGIEAYHADTSHYGSTALRGYATDPLSFYRHYVLGQTRTYESPALATGRAFHAAMEGDYTNQIAVAPKVDRRTRDGKAEWEAFAETAGDRTIITQDDHELVESMLAAVYSHREAAELIRSPGRDEVSFYWRNGGLPLKVRFDRILDTGDVIEYKTIDASGASALKTFARACDQRGYGMQAALYCRGRDEMLAGGKYFYVVVTKTIPAQCMLVKPRPSFLERGNMQLDQTIRRLGASLVGESLNPGEHNWTLPHFTEAVEIA